MEVDFQKTCAADSPSGSWVTLLHSECDRLPRGYLIGNFSVLLVLEPLSARSSNLQGREMAGEC